MKKNTSHDEIGIRYQGFKFTRFGFVDSNNGDDESLGVQLSVDINDAEPAEGCKKNVFVKVTALFIRNSAKEIVANIEAMSLFGIEGIAENVDEQGYLQYPEAVLVTLVSLAISTTRGAILAKGAGSFLERMPLPIVDPKGFVERMKSQDDSGVTG